jgi:hypothetical protein
MGAAENSGETKNKPRVHGQPKDGSSSSRIKRKQQPAAPSDSRHTRGLAWDQAGWLKNLGWACNTRVARWGWMVWGWFFCRLPQPLGRWYSVFLGVGEIQTAGASNGWDRMGEER